MMLRAAAGAILGVLVTVLFAAPAVAAATPLQLSTDGVHFTSGPVGPLFPDGTLLVPGGSVTATLWVRNAATDPADLTVRLAEASAAGPVTLRVGDLPRALPIDPAQVGATLLPTRRLSAGATIRIPVTVSMPAWARGRPADVHVALIVSLGQAVVAVPAGPKQPAPPGDLPHTGVRLTAWLPLAGALLAGGVLLLAAGTAARRRRRRPRSG